MDRLTSMAVFVAVVDHGSLTAAAAEIGLSGPMVGKHVRALEDRLGGPLLLRSTRRQRLTEAGRLYYDQCRAILDQVAAAEGEAKADRAKPHGTLRVSAAVNYGTVVLAPVVADFLTLNPSLRIELILDDRFVDLIEDHFDVALRVGPLADSGLVARRLADYRLTIGAAPAYLLRKGRPMTPEDLAEHDLLGFTRWSRTGEGWSGPRGGGFGPSPESRFVSNNGQALRLAALQGLGLVLQPHALLAEDIAAGRLVEVLEEHLPLPGLVHAVTLRERRAAPRLERFLAYLRQRLPPTRP
jgi:DNA-binding transcriptional LysR family regulator